LIVPAAARSSRLDRGRATRGSPPELLGRCLRPEPVRMETDLPYQESPHERTEKGSGGQRKGVGSLNCPRAVEKRLPTPFNPLTLEKTPDPFSRLLFHPLGLVEFHWLAPSC